MRKKIRDFFIDLFLRLTYSRTKKEIRDKVTKKDGRPWSAEMKNRAMRMATGGKLTDVFH